MPSQIPSQHTVYRLGKPGSYKSVVAHIEPVPQLTANEVLIQTKAVSLNDRDIIIPTGIDAKELGDLTGRILGSDAAGIVVAVGSAVPPALAKVGDHVITNFTPDHQYGPWKLDKYTDLGGDAEGTFREYINLPAMGVTKICPDSPLSWGERASLVCSGVTAWNGLYGNGKLQPGQIVLGLGTGAVSQTALTIAKAAGAVTILTSSSDEKLKTVQKALGIDHIINYKTTPNWGHKVREVTGGHGADIVIETGGPSALPESLEAAAFGGSIALIGANLMQPDNKDLVDYYLKILVKNLVVRGIMVGSHELSEQLMRFVNEKNLRIPVDSEFDHKDGGLLRALEALEAQKHVGKIIVNF
uniref:ARAD1A10802p n=1 Tax=Blastobotrys adeninivorans TaxID=409370 RepID=A0A060T2S3_BLAAD